MAFSVSVPGPQGLQSPGWTQMLPDTGFRGSQTLASWKGGRFPLQWGPAHAPGLLWQSTATWVAKPQKHVVSELWRLRSLKSMCWPGWFPLSTILENLVHTALYGWFTRILEVLSPLRRHRGKESACPCRRCKGFGFDPWIEQILWSRKWQPTLAFLPGEFQGQQSLVGDSPRCHKEADTTEHTQATLGVSKLVVTQLQSSQRCSPSISSASSVATHIGSGARLPPVKPHPNSTSYICSNAISKRDDILRYCGLELHHTNLGRIKFNP